MAAARREDADRRSKWAVRLTVLAAVALLALLLRSCLTSGGAEEVKVTEVPTTTEPEPAPPPPSDAVAADSHAKSSAPSAPVSTQVVDPAPSPQPTPQPETEPVRAAAAATAPPPPAVAVAPGPAPAPVSTPTPTPSPEPAQVAGPTRGPVLAEGNPPADYPLESRRRKEEGTVLVLARVDRAGSVTFAELARSSGHASIDAAALSAVRGWRFLPALDRGSPVECEVELPVTFRLRIGAWHVPQSDRVHRARGGHQDATA